MALTQISDVIVPSVFTDYTQELSDRRNQFIQSGVVVDLQFLNDFLAGGGKTINVPFWQDIDFVGGETESNVGTDNDASSASTDKVVAKEQIAIRANRNNHWKEADLAGVLAGSSAIEFAASRVANYWERQQSEFLIACCQGIIADNDANDNDDMLNDVTTGSLTTASAFSAENYIETLELMGENSDRLVAMSVHPDIYFDMQKLDLIDFIRDSDNMPLAQYRGLRVIVDARMPVVNDTVDDYSCYLFGEGFFGRGILPPPNALVFDREELEADGAGTTLMHSRQQWCYHPFGFQWTEASTAAGGPTNTQLRAATSWDRVFEARENVPFAELRVSRLP